MLRYNVQEQEDKDKKTARMKEMENRRQFAIQRKTEEEKSELRNSELRRSPEGSDASERGGGNEIGRESCINYGRE